MKKLVSMIMAGAMVLALAVPAMAADPAQTFKDASDKGTQTTTVAADVQIPAISIGMPETGEGKLLVVNPYQMKWTGTLGADTIAAGSEKTDQIIAPVLAIQNTTQVDLNVGVSITAKVGGNLKLSTKSAAKDTANNVFVKAIIGPATADDTNGVYSITEDTAQELVVQTSAVTLAKGKTITLEAATIADGATDPTPNYLGFTFEGDAAPAPTTAWSAKDTLTVTIAWTFTPQTELTSE